VGELVKEKERLQQENKGFKGMIKDQNALVTELQSCKIEQKDYIKVLKKMENVDFDLQNMTGVLDQVLDGKFIQVDALFATRHSAITGDVQ